MPKTDVLIVGSGSAGIFAATWLAIYNIPFTILEKRSGPLQIGQADGVQCRTVEIYESFGLSEDLLREAYHVLEVCFWTTEDANAGIKRTSRTIDTEKGLSHLPHVILNQARMNGLMLGKMDSTLKEKKGQGQIEYGWTTKGLSIGDENEEYPCRVTAEKDGKEEVWQAKYVLACDGAHSTIRKSLSIPMLGDTSDTVWGVMDIYPLTTFPDIRRKCTIQRRESRTLLHPVTCGYETQGSQARRSQGASEDDLPAIRDGFRRRILVERIFHRSTPRGILPLFSPRLPHRRRGAYAFPKSGAGHERLVARWV
jgi:phenol 2-monooxygenase